MRLTDYCMQYRDGNKNLPNIAANWFKYRNSKKFVIRVGTREEIFSCGFHQHMCPSSGKKSLKTFPLNPYRKKPKGLRKPPPFGNGGLNNQRENKWKSQFDLSTTAVYIICSGMYSKSITFFATTELFTRNLFRLPKLRYNSQGNLELQKMFLRL